MYYLWNQALSFFTSIYCAKGFHCGISHICVLYLDEINLLCCFLFPPCSLVFNSLQWVSMLFHTWSQYILQHFPPLIHSLSLSFVPLIPPIPPYNCNYVTCMCESSIYLSIHPIYLPFRSRFCIWEKIWGLCLADIS
jgi:hypothetical protein